MSSAKPPILAHQFADLEQQHQTTTLGMWLFLATELMVFGGLFTAYTVYRLRYPAEFAAASQKLNLAYGGVITVVLLTSSLTMALGVWAAQTGRRDLLVPMLALTAALGTAFLVIKGFEYHGDYEEKLMPGLAFEPTEWTNPQQVKMFLLLYYIMTLLHAVHLIIGIAVVGLLTWRAREGWYGSAYYWPVEIGGLYWHFVDVVWIFLLPLLYLVGVRT
jgi:cytochrome c oxidase subunit 3